MTALRDGPCLDVRMDSWRNRSDAATWHWASSARPSGTDARAHNAWVAKELHALFRALWPFARVRALDMNEGPDSPPIPVRSCRWTGDVPHDAFERRALAQVEATEVAVTDVDLMLDLHAWSRTTQSPTVPVHGWICSGASVLLVFEPGRAAGALALGHTLFIDGQLHGDSNRDLHRLNQPLLREALLRIETQIGPIVEVEGLAGVSRTGFDPTA